MVALRVPIHVLTHNIDPTGLGHIELELVRRLEGRNATHLRYRIVHREGKQP
jgi:hypothetical protein